MRILLVSPDAIWAETLDAELRPRGLVFTWRRDAQAALEELRRQPARHFGFLLLSIFPLSGQSGLEAIFDAVAALNRIRGDSAGRIPALICSRSNDSRLDDLLPRGADPPVQVLHDDTPEAVAGAVLARRTPACATVEIEVGANEVRLRLLSEGVLVTETVHGWGGRTKVQRLDATYEAWTPWTQENGSRVLMRNWMQDCKENGTDLAEELALTDGAFQRSIADCVARIGGEIPVHYRFNLISDAASPNPRYPHVPFELVYDTLLQDFLRFSSPVARRLCFTPTRSVAAKELSRDGDATLQRFEGPILFVMADAHGTWVTKTVSFNGRETITLRPLRALEAELANLRAALVGGANRLLPPLRLEAGFDTVEALRQAVLAPDPRDRPRILHFAGHSARADDGEVYLMMPGPVPGRIRPLAIRDLAYWLQDAGVRLVILSSCESASPMALLRLARENIPAAIGFRWEVDDAEAAAFTGLLHGALARGTPLGRAFQFAVRETRTTNTESPTSSSAMLVVQDDEWAQ